MSAGQTSCEFHPHDENILAQGGYDDIIRLWDKRNWKKSLSEVHLRGGVWRTRFNQSGRVWNQSPIFIGYLSDPKTV